MMLFLDGADTINYPTTGGAIWYDSSGNNRHVTLYNAGGATYSSVAAGAPTRSTVKQGEFVFDGVNDWGKMASSISAGADITVSVWLKLTDTLDRGFLSHCSGGPVNLGYGVNAGKMHYKYYSGAWLTASGTTSVNDGNWKNLVWAKSGTSMSMYINGNLDYSTTLSASVSGLLICIGSYWGPCNSDSYGAGTDSYGSVFAGTMGSLMIHTTALSATEVAQNFNALRGRFGV
jgi:hypothetical protein